MVASSITGGEGNGTTHAKFVPSPVNRVSMTSRSTPLVKLDQGALVGNPHLHRHSGGGMTSRQPNRKLS